MQTESLGIEATFKGLHVEKDGEGRLSVELVGEPMLPERDMGSLVELFCYLGARFEEYGETRAKELVNEGLLVLVERRDRATGIASWLSVVAEFLEDDIEDALRDKGTPVQPDVDEGRDEYPDR